MQTISFTALMDILLRRLGRFFSAVISLILLAGCSSRASILMVPFSRSDLLPTEPLYQTVPVNEAYYWSDEDGKLNIALRYHSASLLGRAFEADWQMSIVLDGLPAGSEKLYRLGTSQVRMLQSYGGDRQRGSSIRGVAVVYAPQHRRIRGRFHVSVYQRRFHVLRGWLPAAMMVAVGQFEAIEDPVRGKRILAQTEADGFDRKTDRLSSRPVLLTPASGPATQPTSAPATRSRP